MKRNLPLLAAICLAFAGGFSVAPHAREGGESDVSPTQDAPARGTEAPVKPPADAAVEPGDAVPAVSDLPEMRMYAPASCVICDQLFREIEKSGGEKVLPFKILKLPLLNWMNDGPWFYWRSSAPSGWSRIHGLNTLNGKRLDWLLQEWVKTQPEARKVDSENITVCCCEGTNTQSCLCLEEIRRGVKRGPCTCNSRFGSRHFMDLNGKPIGPAGGYSELTAETKRIRRQSQSSYCPNCRRK